MLLVSEMTCNRNVICCHHTLVRMPHPYPITNCVFFCASSDIPKRTGPICVSTVTVTCNVPRIPCAPFFAASTAYTNWLPSSGRLACDLKIHYGVDSPAP